MELKFIILLLISFFGFQSLSQRKLKDNRDGKKYKIVRIGHQTWMAENLAYNFGKDSWMYNNDSVNLIKYGYLYSWEVSQKVCPKNWHLPSKIEFDTLVSFLGGEEISGSKLKTNYLNDSTIVEYEEIHSCNHQDEKQDSIKVNSSEFNSYFGGAIYYGNEFDYLNEYACYWTSDVKNENFGIYFYLLLNKSNVLFDNSLKINGMSVRCIKD